MLKWSMAEQFQTNETDWIQEASKEKIQLPTAAHEIPQESPLLGVSTQPQSVNASCTMNAEGRTQPEVGALLLLVLTT